MRRQIGLPILFVLMLLGTTFSNRRAVVDAAVVVTTTPPPSSLPTDGNLMLLTTTSLSTTLPADEQQITISLPTYQPPNRLMPSSPSPMPAISSSSAAATVAPPPSKATTTSGPMRATLLARPAWDSVAIESQRRSSVAAVTSVMAGELNLSMFFEQP